MLGFFPIAGGPIADAGTVTSVVVVAPPTTPVPPVVPVPDPTFDAWLRGPVRFPVTLYEVIVNVGGAEITRYLSNGAYGGGDPASPYLAVVNRGTGDLELDGKISYDGAAQLSYGDITLDNTNGSLDSWLFDVWANRRINVYVGDMRWQRTSFKLMCSGWIADIAPGSDQTSIVLKFRDVLQGLNASLSDATMADGTTLRMNVFGEVANLTPKLKNAATGEYEINAGAIEDIPRVRSDGKPRDITKNLSVGSFTLATAAGPGALTASVQGDKGDGIYRNRIAPIIQRIVTGYGPVATRLATSDIDTDNFAAFDAACPQPVGVAYSDRVNVIDACAQLASSKGAQLIPSRLGKLRLIQFNIPATATTEIHPSSMVGMQIVATKPFSVQASVKLGYCQNYTPENNLQTSIPATSKQALALDWRTVTSVDSTVQAAYRLSAAPPTQKNTCLLAQTDAQAESDRLLGIVKVPRMTYSFPGTPDTILLELGQAVMLFSPRYQLQSGKPGLVTRFKANYGTLATTIEVTV